jgi:hypothetical protein
MPHVHFHLNNAVGLVHDGEGQEAADLDEARAIAIENIRSILAEDVRHGLIDLSGRIEVTDGDGRLLLVVPFADAVTIRTDNAP